MKYSEQSQPVKKTVAQIQTIIINLLPFIAKHEYPR